MRYTLKSLALTIGFTILAISKITFAAKSAADYFVRSLPGLPDNANVKSHAGHITIDESTNSNIFFWLIHNRHIANRPKLIIWLNGGPGCSSMDGVFLETGPWRINGDQTLRLINGSWNEYANVLYVDQPVGTGFSFANSNSYLNNVTQVPGQFMLFLDKFFEVFPEYSKDDMYMAGESYAGTFIPYIASGILKRNHERKTADYLKYNLKGIAIGNGWIDPITQYNAYYTFAIEHNLLTGSYKTLAEDQLKICLNTLASQKENRTIHLDICEQVLQTVLKGSRKRIGKKETCINQYDIRDHSDSYPSCGLAWPYELPSIYKYLRRPDVIGAIHASAQQIGWVECSSGVSRGFTNDKSLPSITLLPSILKQINVLLYGGDQDLICNNLGIQDMIKGLEWNGAKGFQNLTAKPWFFNNTLTGHILSERNLTFIAIHNASHMVPYDLPLASMDMMYRFIGLSDQILTKYPSYIGYESTNKSSGVSPGDIEKWDKYYNAGTITLVIVVCGVIGLAAFFFGGKWRHRRSISRAMKAAVENSSSEMDELVIETPLYRSDDIDHFGDSDDDDGRSPHRLLKNREVRYIDDESEKSQFRSSEDRSQ